MNDQTDAKRTKATPQHLYEILKEKIFDRKLVPGEKLNIDQLARELNVSAIPVREALSRLHADKLAEFEAFKGYRVSIMLDCQAVCDLLSARQLIELHAVREIIRQNNQEAVDGLVHLNVELAAQQTQVSYMKFKKFNELDRQFHHLIVACTNNRFLMEAYEGMHVHLHLARLYHERGEVDQREAVEEHGKLVEALRTRDLYSAERALMEHIQGAKSRLLQDNVFLTPILLES